MVMVGLLIILVMVIAILWSVIEGIGLMIWFGKGDQYWYRGAGRMLAWNLLEPGITAPWVLLNLVVFKNLPEFITIPRGLNPTGRPSFSVDLVMTTNLPLLLIQYLWPMVVVLVLIPMMGMLSSRNETRVAARKSLALGVGRIALTVLAVFTFGIASLGGLALLIISVHMIRSWANELTSNRKRPVVFEQNGVRILPLIPTEGGCRVITIRGLPRR